VIRIPGISLDRTTNENIKRIKVANFAERARGKSGNYRNYPMEIFEIIMKNQNE
jgi:hypothetical protein